MLGAFHILQTESERTIVEVELVEVHSLHQVSQSFGLKGSESRVTDSPVGQQEQVSVV